MLAAAIRAIRDRGVTASASQPSGHHSRRNRCPTASVSDSTPLPTTIGATPGATAVSRSLRARRAIDMPAAPIAANGRRATTRRTIARLRADSRAGARRRGWRLSNTAAEVP